MTATLPWTRRARSEAVPGSRLRPRPRAGAVAFAVITLVAIVMPLLAPHSPTAVAGAPFSSPSAHAWFGTDDVGHDVLSRVLFGLRSSWLSALIVVTVSVVIGVVVGGAAGLGPRWLDEVLMRINDGLLAVPAALVAIAVVAALGPSLPHTLIGITIVWWPYYARIIRGEVRSLRARPHVEAAIASGAGRMNVAFRHVLPGAATSIVVAASLDIGYVVLTLASLSFLGLGAAPPAPELGAMSAQGLSDLLTAWWIPIFPGIGVAALTLAANLAGDSLATQPGGGR
jgi:peptide/nickel transport system permease protein